MRGRCASLLRAKTEAAPKTLSSCCSELAGCLTSCSRLARLAVDQKRASSLSVPCPRPFQGMAVTLPQPQKQKKGTVICIEQLWQEFMSHPSRWWDCRTDKVSQKSPRSPFLRCKHTKEVLSIEYWENPPWVQAQLAATIQGRAQSGDGSCLNVRHGAPSRKHNGMAGLNQTQPRDGVNRNSSGCGGDVRNLCKAGRLKEALYILKQQGIWADSNTYVCLLQECVNLKDLSKGKEVHAHIIESGFKPSNFLLNTLVNMYAKCGSLVDARTVFDQMPEQTLFTWTIMIGGYAKNGYGREALKLHEQMQQEGVMPNKVTFICLLNACASLGALEKGKEIHADIIKHGITADINLETALADMYAKCRSMKHARQVFDNMSIRNVVSWSAMIAGYAQNGCGREAFEIYAQMQHEGAMPNRVTFTCVLNACASLLDLKKGRGVHADIIKAGIVPDIILQTALTDMYAKCGSMKDARGIFNNMAKRSVVSWNALITGYTHHGCGREAFEVYEQMHREGVTPDRITYTGVLNACASVGALDKGRQVHVDISNSGILPEIILENTLVDMYAKSGRVDDAREVFNNMAKRNVVSWSTMIAGYAQHGSGREALDLFEQMHQQGFKPDGIAFVSVLSACSHVGLVDEGLHYFDSIIRDHGLTPTVEHFGCLVDLLGRAGRLHEAEGFIKKLPLKPDGGMWRALLGACRIHGNMELAECVAKCILKMES